jgi:hypothetical protein
MFTLMACSLVLAAFLLHGGCSKDDEEGGSTEPGACAILAQTPHAGAVYYTDDPDIPDDHGDIVGIRWQKSGSATRVRLELLKDDAVLGTIVESTSNSYPYYYPWYASTMGQVSGDDYRVRIAAIGVSDCADTTAEFSILNVAGCSVLMTNPPIQSGVVEWNENDEVDITWDSEFTTNLMDIELWLGDEMVGLIAQLVPDDGIYTWTVDSFHQGTDNQYRILVKDNNVDDCEGISGTFIINDENICNIGIVSPQQDDVWVVGQQETIQFFAEQSSGFVDIILQEGSQYLGYVAQNVDVTAGEYEWMVGIIGSPQTNNSFRLKIVDSNDEYCYEVSERFTINEIP